MQPKILILTVSHGASHERASAALGKALLEARPDLTVTTWNGLERSARWFRLYYDSYQIPLRHWPRLWGWVENIQHRSRSTGPGWLYRRGAQPLFSHIETFGPDVVIATEVGMCELAAMLKRETAARFRLVALVTGVDADRAWAQPEVDLYVTAPGDPAGEIEAAGVPHAKILPCGQPVDPAFASLSHTATVKATVRARLGIRSDLPMALVLFGGTGWGKPRGIVEALNQVEQPLQAVFVTGRNQRLEEDVRSLCHDNRRCRVLGWVDNMHEWMAAADLLVSKPGASTLMEALSCGLPLLAIDPLPGNERRACDWIEKQRVGCWIKNPPSLGPSIARLLENPAELKLLRERAQAWARPRAAYDAADAILKLVVGS
jgi:processive 1,2-diacylglycerol beta-glucosyltransferase